MTALFEETSRTQADSEGLDTVISPDRLATLIRHLSVGHDAELAPVIAPFNGRTVAHIPLSSEAAVDTAFAIARKAQEHWAHTSVAARARIMLRFHDLILDRREEVLDIVQLETGKARNHAVEELLDVAITARHYARVAGGLLKPRKQSGAFPLLTSAVELHHPKGVIGAISPWNYPLTLAVGDAIPALLAGNAVVLKPDLQTTLTALWAIDLLYEAGLPDGLFGVVSGEGSVVGPMITERGDYIMFTGSTGVGRQVAARCGERLVGCSMELGGKNAMIICDDANIKKAAEIAERASFANAGQLCISMERIYVHSSVMDDFLRAFSDRLAKVRLKAEIGWESDMGSLISHKQLETVNRHVGDAVTKGATVICGGKPRPDIGPFYFEPTVLTNVSPDMVCSGEETFGPVVSIYPFDTEAQAIALANETTYGLNASVITRDERRGREIASKLHAGTVNVNEGYATAWSSLGSPMGGWGDSGLGRRHGTEGIMKYTEAQTIGTQRIMGWGTPPFLTHKQWADSLTLFVRGMKAVGKK
jgi:succinate-semialdehyde dehydrogenase/glutarate-semialdehyde dehydrogenase